MSVNAVRSRSGHTWLLWFLALGLGLLLYVIDEGSTPPPAPPAPVAEVPPPVAEVAPPPAPPADGLIDRTLGGGVIRIAPAGIEAQLLDFIGDPDKKVDKTTWFSFDRLEFETDSATLSPSAGAQLDNIAAILKAYPAVNLKIGGYTDNTGNKAANLKLSKERAAAALAGIVSRGIDASRLASEGYGEEHPVADNATEEGRARNRRIDVHVTRK